MLTESPKIVWAGDRYVKVAHAHVSKQVHHATIRMANLVRANLMLNIGPPHSTPGEYPYLQTGALRRSIRVQVDEHKLSGVVGTDSVVGKWLEEGTRGGIVIVARPGGVLTWVDRAGVRHFATRVIRGPIIARRFLKRTFNEGLDDLKKVLLKAWPDFKIL